MAFPFYAVMTGSIGYAPDAAAIERIAREAFDGLPDPFQDHLDGIIVRVEEFADEDVLRDMEIEDPWDLTGLYQGYTVGEQSQWMSGEMPPVILLYRSPLLAEWIETGVTLEDLIRHVVVHEVGHHFGLSDEDMDAIELSLMADADE